MTSLPQNKGVGCKHCATQAAASGKRSSTPAMTACRVTQLKALRRSTWRSTQSAGPAGARTADSTAAWTAMGRVSHGPPRQNATCAGNTAAISAWPAGDRRSHFAATLLRHSPTAMGRTPPSFFRTGMSRAAQRYGMAAGWMHPPAAALAKRTSASNRAATADVSAVETMSDKCCGLRPLGPAAPPGGKERRSSRMASTSAGDGWA